MKIIIPFTFFLVFSVNACSSGTSEDSGNEHMSFCDCADYEGEYKNEEDRKFCEKKMSDWKDKLKNGDEKAQQEAMEEMEICS